MISREVYVFLAMIICGGALAVVFDMLRAMRMVLNSVCGNSFCKRYIVLDICGICNKCGGVEFKQRNI